MLLQGLFVPLTCPFTRDGALFLSKLDSNVRRYSLAPIAGMIALPPVGEAASLTDDEASDTLRTVGDAAAKEKVLVAGVQRSSVVAALELARAAAHAGFDAILLAPPPDWARLVHGKDARQLLAFYQCVADASPLPVVLWSEAQVPSLALPLVLIGELARHPNVIGLIDADLTPERLRYVVAGSAGVRRDVTVTTIFEAVTRRMLAASARDAAEQATANTASARGEANLPSLPILQALPVPGMKTRTRSVGFQVLSAAPAYGMPALLEAGVAGAAPALAAAAPQGCFEAYAAWKDGDPALSAERAARLKNADETLAALGPAALNYACDWNAYAGGLPRLPRLRLTAEERSTVERALGDVRN